VEFLLSALKASFGTGRARETEARTEFSDKFGHGNCVILRDSASLRRGPFIDREAV